MPSSISIKFPSLKQAIGLITLISVFYLSYGSTVSLYADSIQKNSFPGKIIGQIQTNRHAITIVSGSENLTFTIHSQDGNVLAQDLLLSNLVAGFPELAKTLSTGLAGNDARLMPME